MELDTFAFGDTLDMSGGVESMFASPGKGRQKKGKAGGHFNPFVEFEDREMRLNWERRWLKDDEVYMKERLKGMRLDSVQGRLHHATLSGDMLYEDAIYYGPYSCTMRNHQQKKADSQRRPVDAKIPAIRGAAAAIEEMEAEHHAKTKKGQGDKAKPTQEVISLKSMQAVLEASGNTAASTFGSDSFT